MAKTKNRDTTKDKDTDESPCKLVICKNPETGEVMLKSEGECPIGWIREIVDAINKRGLTIDYELLFGEEEKPKKR